MYPSVNITYPNEESISFDLQQQGGKGQRALSLHAPGTVTKDQIKKATVQMLRTLISMATTLKTLPDERFLTMKLLYYDSRTPEEYQVSYLVLLD